MFDQFILFVVFINTMLLILGDDVLDMHESYFLFSLDFIIVFIFIVEMLVKIIGLGPGGYI